jgi:spermidine synthase
MLTDRYSSTGIHWLAALTGLAALSWEVLWQLKSSLALGVSAHGTALTLAVTMGGMSLGALLCGHALKERPIARPVRLYGIFEFLIGISGLFLGMAFRVAARLDTWAYTAIPGNGSLIHILVIVVALGVPTMCMGATLPVFGLVARQYRTSIALLYGLNTLGAALGALLAAFLLIPLLGVTGMARTIAALNMVGGLVAWLLGPGERVITESQREAKSPSGLSRFSEQWIVLVTGFATFVLEVAWFRSLTAAFQSTTAAFAIMLAAVLVALGLAAAFVPLLKKVKAPLGTLVSWAGIFILFATPLIERFDLLPRMNTSPARLFVFRFFMTLSVIGLPVLLLGVAVPWILDAQDRPRRWGKLYALNTLAAIAGSIGAAWALLPTIGFARTAWLAGTLVAVAGILVSPPRRRIAWAGIGCVAFLIAGICESGVDRTRVQGAALFSGGSPGKVLEAYEGPEATISVVEYADKWRRIIIDGASASGQSSDRGSVRYDHYMPWMGRLPMLLDVDPKNALVICFGTGQTANAVRQENPRSLDIVDINPRVFKLAHNFISNQDVLDDPRVNHIVMDGRAYMRRTKKTYDVITLEPMPPIFAGVNNLYSKEFYELARKRLAPHGLIAQWLPFHAVAPPYAASIARTFQDVFPNSILWLDKTSENGILLGTNDDDGNLGSDWPGFARPSAGRDLTEDEVKKAVLLDQKELSRYGKYGKIITDDNQLLAYSNAVLVTLRSEAQKKENLDFISNMDK